MRSVPTEEAIRLNRYLALLGLGSRRACDEIIHSGRVEVDGKTVTELSTRIVPGVNRVRVGGIPLEKPPSRLVLLLNKPEGIVCTVSDPRGRKTVIDICRAHNYRRRLFPVGRLDINSSGALLLTNDGMLCYRLTHPRFHIPKTYHVKVRGFVDAKKLHRLDRLAKGRREPQQGTGAGVELVKKLGKESIVKIVLHEGKKHQIRDMCSSVGLAVIKLKRVTIGPVSIRRLPEGAVRPLTEKELKLLYRAVSLEG